jgi:protein subunit release factor B
MKPSFWIAQNSISRDFITRLVDFQTLRENRFMDGSRSDEILEIFSRSSGPGGQHVNKVSTAVTLKHLATGIRVTVSDSRSQARNRAIARERLAEKIVEADRRKKLLSLADAARERRRKARRSRGTKARLVEGKRRRGETKKMRGKVPVAGG